jgi:hypothetical protein
MCPADGRAGNSVTVVTVMAGIPSGSPAMLMLYTVNLNFTPNPLTIGRSNSAQSDSTLLSVDCKFEFRAEYNFNSTRKFRSVNSAK